MLVQNCFKTEQQEKELLRGKDEPQRHEGGRLIVDGEAPKVSGSSVLMLPCFYLGRCDYLPGVAPVAQFSHLSSELHCVCLVTAVPCPSRLLFESRLKVCDLNLSGLD